MKQRTNTDCGIVAVALLAGKSYKAVKDVCGPCKGLYPHEVEWLLTEFFEEVKRVRVRKTQTLDEWVKRHKKGRYLVATGSFLTGHAVAVIDGEAHNAIPTWGVDRVWKVN